LWILMGSKYKNIPLMDELPESNDLILKFEDELLHRDGNWEEHHDSQLQIKKSSLDGYEHAIDLGHENSFEDKNHYMIDEDRIQKQNQKTSLLSKIEHIGDGPGLKWDMDHPNDESHKDDSSMNHMSDSGWR
jgi:hypothetical protein